MTSDGTLSAQPSRRNNFGVIRLFAAWLVLYGHSHVFLKVPEPRLLDWIHAGPLGVSVFFIISGYLIAKSHSSDPRLATFLSKRSLRIFPALVVCTLLSAFVLGPLVTTLPASSYLSEQATYNYLSNIVLYINYYLPGVFTDSAVPNAVNGSLWSLPVEFAMYLAVAVVGLLNAGRRAYLLLFLVSCVANLSWTMRTSEMFVIYGTDMKQLFLCGAYFWAGSCVFAFRLERFMTVGAVVSCVVALTLASRGGWLISTAVSWIALPVIVPGFGLDYSPILNRAVGDADFSYGIYIYAFPIQQTIASLYPNLGLASYVLLTSMITLVFAAASWFLIERPILGLKLKLSFRQQAVGCS